MSISKRTNSRARIHIAASEAEAPRDAASRLLEAQQLYVKWLVRNYNMQMKTSAEERAEPNNDNS